MGTVAKTLCISLEETTEEDADLVRFNALLETLKSHGGDSAVRLTILSQGKTTELDISVTVSCDDMLLERLVSLLGEHAVRVV